MARTYKPKSDPTGYPDFTLPIGLLMQLIPVKLVPDWGAIQAEDVDVVASMSIAHNTETRVLIYTVPTGKTLLIYDWSIAMYGDVGEVMGRLTNETTGTTLSVGGGARGFQTPLSKPKRVTSGQVVGLWMKQNTGTDQWVYVHFGGTLI